MNVVFPPVIGLPLFVGLAALAVALLGFALAGTLRASSIGRVVVLLRMPAAAVGIVLLASAFFAPTPQTQLPNPVPRTVDSIAQGRTLYQNSCASCHGVDARGGGPLHQWAHVAGRLHGAGDLPQRVPGTHEVGRLGDGEGAGHRGPPPRRRLPRGREGMPPGRTDDGLSLIHI